MEDHVKRELGCEEGEEPLRGVHVSFQTHVQEMVVKVWYIFLLETKRSRGVDVERGKLRRACCHGVRSEKRLQIYRSNTHTHTPA